MTKTAGLVLAATALLLAAPAAVAHGAPEPREIDHRVLHDDDGIVPYQGCFNASCAASEALDLLALEVREAALPTGEPILVFRLIAQSETAAAGRAVDLRFSAGGSERAFDWLSDGATFTSGTFEGVAGPFDVGDGHPKAVEGWVRHSALGVAPGEEITGITMESRVGEEVGDIMPGSWMVQGTEVPAVREEPTAPEEGPGIYAVAGPAPLLSVSPSGTRLADGPVAVTVSNPLEGLEQLVSVAVEGSASASTASLLLAPGGSGTFNVTMAEGADPATLLVWSDLGGFGSVAFDAIPVQPPAGNGTEDGHDHDDLDPEGEEGTGDKGAPGLPGLAVLGVALLAAALRRR